MSRWPENRVARFDPQRTDDLRGDSADYIGRVTLWTYAGIAEGGDYDGQTQWSPAETGWPFAWVPACDLADVVKVDTTVSAWFAFRNARPDVRRRSPSQEEA